MKVLLGSGIIAVSVLSNVLLWFFLKYFKNIQPSTYLTLQFGCIWTLAMVVALCILFVGKHKQAQSNRFNFIQDLQKLKAKDWMYMLLASSVAILSFYLVMVWFQNPDTGISKFLPLRTALAVIILAILGVVVFKEKLNKISICGLVVLLIGFIVLFIGRFFS